MTALRVTAAMLCVALAMPGCKVAAGAGCADEGAAQCDGASMLVCEGHRWRAVSCMGPAGCKVSGRMVDCDETLARVGDPCGPARAAYSGCSIDGKTRLACDSGRWKADIPCRGPKGCVVSGRFVDCDDTVARQGDACEPDALTCAEDGSAVLACRGGKYVLDQACGPGHCMVEGDTVGCELNGL